MAPKRFEIEIERPLANVYDAFVENSIGLWVLDDEVELNRLTSELAPARIREWGEVRAATDRRALRYKADEYIVGETLVGKVPRMTVEFGFQARGAATAVTLSMDSPVTGIWRFSPFGILMRRAYFNDLKRGLEVAKQELEGGRPDPE